MGFFERICTGITVGNLVIKRGVVILLSGQTSPPFRAWPKSEPGFPTSYVMVFCLFSKLRGSCCVDLGGIDYPSRAPEFTPGF